MTDLLPGQLSDIAVRGYVAPTRALSGRRSRGAWPTTAMLLATECNPIPGEPIAVGAYRLLDETVPGPGSLRLFYPDTTPGRDIETITTYTRENRLPAPIPQSELLKKIYYWIYRERVPLVCYSAPAELCQLAADWTRLKSPSADEFSLILWTRPDTRQRASKAERKRRPRLRNSEIENGDRPRIILKAIDGHRTIMRFTDRREADPRDRIPEAGDEHPGDKYRWPGRFVSLQQAVYAQVGEVARNLADILALYGLDGGPEPPLGSDLASQLDHLAWHLDALTVAYPAVLAEHQAHTANPAYPLDTMYSPASYAGAILAAGGYTEPRRKWEIPNKVLGIAMGAYFGGDSMVARRRTDEAIIPIDFKNQYVAVQHLLGVPDVLRAQKLCVVDRDPAELAEFVSAVSHDRLLDPATWHEIGLTFVHVIPNGDPLPHKPRTPTGDLQFRVSPLTGRTPLPFHLADVVAAFLQTGRVPRIVSGFTITRDGVQAGLRPATLATGREINPEHDPFLAMAEERTRLAVTTTAPTVQRERWRRFYKLAANSGCSGLFAQANPGTPDTKPRVVWTETGESKTTKNTGSEEPGRWSFPPIAAAITAGGRLLLHLTRHLWETDGGTVAYWDTDSLHLVRYGFDASHVEALRSRLESLSPYDPKLRPRIDLLEPRETGWVPTRLRRPQFLELEDENYDGGPAWPHEIHLNASSSKNYDIYTTSQPGPHVEIHDGQPVVIDPPPTVADLRIEKASHHGFGHLLDPRTLEPFDSADDWVIAARTQHLKRRIGLPHAPYVWLNKSALSVITLNHTPEVERLGGFNRRRRTAPRPWSRTVIAHPISRYDHDGNRIIPAAPYHRGFDSRAAEWRDLTSGRPLSILIAMGELRELDLVPGGPIAVRTIRRVLESNATRPETKALTPDGEPVRPDTVGPLIPAPTDVLKVVLIGRENQNFDRIGITQDPHHAVLSNPEKTTWDTLTRPTIRDLAPRAPGGIAAISATTGIARTTLDRALKGGSTSRRTQTRLLPVAGELARAVVAALLPAAAAAENDEHACHHYLRHSGQLTPAACLACGRALAGRQRKWCAECRSSARRRSRARPIG